MVSSFRKRLFIRVAVIYIPLPQKRSTLYVIVSLQQIDIALIMHFHATHVNDTIKVQINEIPREFCIEKVHFQRKQKRKTFIYL